MELRLLNLHLAGDKRAVTAAHDLTTSMIGNHLFRPTIWGPSGPASTSRHTLKRWYDSPVGAFWPRASRMA